MHLELLGAAAVHQRHTFRHAAFALGTAPRAQSGAAQSSRPRPRSVMPCRRRAARCRQRSHTLASARLRGPAGWWHTVGHSPGSGAPAQLLGMHSTATYPPEMAAHALHLCFQHVALTALNRLSGECGINGEQPSQEIQVAVLWSRKAVSC